jgi:hypothetical protein
MTGEIVLHEYEILLPHRTLDTFRIMRKDFYHELLQPYQALVVRASRNDLVGSGVSDVTAAANSLAVTAAHFLEVRSLPFSWRS